MERPCERRWVLGLELSLDYKKLLLFSWGERKPWKLEFSCSCIYTKIPVVGRVRAMRSLHHLASSIEICFLVRNSGAVTGR